MGPQLKMMMRWLMGGGGGEFEYFPRDIVLQQHQGAAETYDKISREGDYKVTTTMVDEQGAVAPCLTPVAELNPVTLRELRAHVGRFAQGRILRLTLLREATQIVSIQFPAIDDEGTAIQVSVYNQTGGKILSKAQLRRLYPEGSRVLVMHPYVKRSRGGMPCLQVDHPHNVVTQISEG